MDRMIKINGMYYSDFRQNGRRIRRALSPHKPLAEKMRDDLLALRSSEKTGIMPDSMSWFGFKEKYLQHRKANKNPKTYFNDERMFWVVEKYGRPLDQIVQMTPEYVDDLKVRALTHKTDPLTKRTISGHVRRIKTAMHFARKQWKLTPKMDWDMVECLPDRKRKDYLSYPEFQKVMKASEGPYERATMILGFGGLRRGEVLNLHWSSVDFKNHCIEVVASGTHAPKGSEDGDPKERKVPMIGKLERYLKGLPDKTGLVLGEAINEDNFSTYYRKLGYKLGIKLFPHKFRHSCASFLISTGSSLPEVGKVLGQDDIRSTQIYTHMLPGVERHAMDRMEKGLGRLAQNGNGVGE